MGARLSKIRSQEMSRPIINLEQWFASPPGRLLRDWELARADQAMNGCFGYHALQTGMQYLPLLRNSRIQHRWVAATETPVSPLHAEHRDTATALVLEPDALPFGEASMDLVLLPHTLEASADPHAVLREAARVLVPEGRLLVFGFNPVSLWGLQQKGRLLAQRMGSREPPVIPDVDDLIRLGLLRDWLRLLGFEIEGGRFGCYRPSLRNEKWFNHLQWLEAAGDRWWPFMGGAYFLQATKRVLGVRRLQPRWKLAKQARNTAAALHRHHKISESCRK